MISFGLFFFEIVFIGFAVYNFINANYKKTEYFKSTHIPYIKMLFNKGRAGEYLTYNHIKALSGDKKFLFNCYIPTEKGVTTEIDVIMLHESGIYVFESKNFSGWIFGTENQKEWVQTLPIGRGRSRKSHFYNPIIQNKGHLRWLQAYIKDTTDLPFYSYIVFSDRCTLKKIQLTSNNHFVIKQNELFRAVSQQASSVGAILTKDIIDSLYNQLYPLTQTDEAAKTAHIQNIARQQKPQIAPAVSPTTLLCPRCGGTLKVRTAKKGANAGQEFYGCSNFPKCRYVHKLYK